MKLAVFIVLAILFLAQKIYEEGEPIGELFDYSIEELLGVLMYLVPRIIIIGIAYIILF